MRASKSKNAPLKGNDERNSSGSNGYTIQIIGPRGREHHTLRHKGHIVGGGDLRQAIAKGKGRERLERFECKTDPLVHAERDFANSLSAAG